LLPWPSPEADNTGMGLMEYLTKRLAREYPDISTIQEIYKDLVNKSGKEIPDGDHKYRPLPLVLAVLYRLQARHDAAHQEVGQQLDEGEELLELLGYYWHLQHSLGKTLRAKLDKAAKKGEITTIVEKNRLKIAEVSQVLAEGVHV